MLSHIHSDISLRLSIFEAHFELHVRKLLSRVDVCGLKRAVRKPLVVSLSSRSVLHKEPKGGTLLAENSAPNGGDGVPDQRGDP